MGRPRKTVRALIAAMSICGLAATARAATPDAPIANVTAWRWAHPRPAGVVTTKILWTGERFLAFSDTQVLESRDGRDWTELGGYTILPLYDAVVFGGRIVAVTDNTVQSSLDGLAWKVHLDYSWDRPCSYFGGVATDGPTVVAVGFSCQESMGAFGMPMVFTSEDGMSWQPVVLPRVDWSSVRREELTSVTWNGQLFVAAGLSDCQEVLYTSPDGREWSRTPGVGGTVAASGGGITVVANGARVWRSVDGDAWSEAALPDGTSIQDAEWVGDRFVAASPGGVLTSPDGALWSFTPLAADAQLAAVASDGSRVVLGGRDFYFSDDGADWTAWQTQRLTTVSLWDVAVGPGRAVAIGDDGTVLTSANGDDWTLAASAGTSLDHVVYGGGRWLALGYRGALWSDDGVLWHASEGIPDRAPLDLAWGGGLFVALTAWDGTYVSVDGVAWERGDPLNDYWVSTVSWAGSEFVASAKDMSGSEIVSVLLHSHDGRTWWSTPTPEPRWGTSRVVAVGGRMYVADGGHLYSSQDGESWTLIPMDDYVRDLDASGDQLLVTTSGGGLALRSSSDGVHWVLLGPLPAISNAFAVFGTRLIAVGFNGSICTLDRTLPRPPRLHVSVPHFTTSHFVGAIQP